MGNTVHLRHVDTDIGSYHMAAGKSCYLLRLFDKLGVHFLQSVGQSGEISTQAYNSFVKFCVLENAE